MIHVTFQVLSSTTDSSCLEIVEKVVERFRYTPRVKSMRYGTESCLKSQLMYLG